MESDGTMDCSWCGAAAPAEGGYRLLDIEGRRRLAFCRLEHVIPWIIREGRRQRGEIELPTPDELSDARESLAESCSQCDRRLDASTKSLLLVRERAGERIEDSFCEMEHLRQWAAAGGRWARSSR